MKEQKKINIPVDGKISPIFISLYLYSLTETFLWDSKQNLKVSQLPFMASICPWREVMDLVRVRK